MDEPRLEGRVAVVTGASRGIGRAIALQLAADGAHVAVNYASGASAAQTVVAEIEAAGGRGIAVGGDVSDASAVDRIFDETEAQLGPVAVLVNNAGVHHGGRIDALSVDAFDAVVATSLRGTFLCSRRAVPGMRAARWGRVITISSPVALRGYAGDVAYGSAKAAQLGLTRCLAVELARTGVTVNAVLPGFVLTDMTAGLSEKAIAAMESSIPAGRTGEPAEVGAAVSFLASPASSYITGATLSVDGGIVL